MLLLISSVTFLLIGYAFGFYVRSLWDKLQYLQKRAAEAIRRDDSTPKSRIISPDETPAERILREQEELLERLNPNGQS